MSTVIVNDVRRGFYLDSVALMRFSRTISGLDGVEEAALMMGTPANREIMSDAGLLDDAGRAAEGGDLIIGIRAENKSSAERALAESKALLDQPTARDAEGVAWHPRTLRAALKQEPDASLALISVPGDFAIAEARKAIRRGLHAMIFSDNVDVQEEASLKQEARDLGLLVMGPDCGTAIVNGTPLAFANRVSRGGVGIVGASGTGTQEVSCLISQYGGGISHAIGVGGRDLAPEVGAISTLMAIDALDDDPATEHIVLVSKPPESDVAMSVLSRIGKSTKPVTICFIGAGEMQMPANAAQVFTLKDAARSALALGTDAVENAGAATIEVPKGRGRVSGLFSGGTLCAEAQVIFAAAGEDVTSNAPVPGVPKTDKGSEGHILLDLGADEYTRGKPHPMIDPSVRDEAMIEALKEKSVGVILADIVIGFGAHDDPAGHFAKLLQENATDICPAIVASVTGTEEDPQVRSSQIAKLEAVGVHVAPTNADAARWALSTMRARG
ncbi:MAG: acyl-CoA synthetase FdrA [Hyphomicrobiaceae bacterium]|nr:acyl-CoA synthetase FdrA [Hyphomicrobiaceae bacterium]